MATTVPVAGATAAHRPLGQSTPTQLWRLLIVLVAATLLLWITATILLQGLQGVTQPVRDSTSPAYLDALAARAALSDADRAAWQSFGSGVAQLTGPGQQYQNDIINAGQALERLAALDASDSTDSSLLQTVSGQLVNYEGLVEQADAAYRRDVALGAGSTGDLGFAYLTYASNAMRDPQGGLLASIGQLADTSHQALGGQMASPWANPALLAAFAVPALVVLAGLVFAQVFLRRRFKRTLSPPLLLACAMVIGLFAWLVTATVHADSAFTAARSTALPKLTGLWQSQTRAVGAEAATLRSSSGGAVSATAPGGLNAAATGQASRVLDADLASAEDTAGLPIGIPALAAAIAAAAYLGFRPRLSEYRGGGSDRR